jgi:Protein of unknown function (DUF2891)
MAPVVVTRLSYFAGLMASAGYACTVRAFRIGISAVAKVFDRGEKSRSGHARTPSVLHPIIYGRYDWHSCVHSYWVMAQLLRRFPDSGSASDICALFEAQLFPDKIVAECSYFARPTARGLKRPYGYPFSDRQP